MKALAVQINFVGSLLNEAEPIELSQRILDVKRDQKRSGRHLGGERLLASASRADGSLTEHEGEQAAIRKEVSPACGALPPINDFISRGAQHLCACCVKN
jgi:hypothetical protein